MKMAHLFRRISRSRKNLNRSDSIDTIDENEDLNASGRFLTEILIFLHNTVCFQLLRAATRAYQLFSNSQK